MKTKLSITLLIIALSPVPFALCQIPQGFNYQAVARDLSTGNPIANTTMPVYITIQADSAGTQVIWKELHPSITTNSFGMLTLVIGKGNRQTESTVAAFSDINWSVTPKFIKTQIDYGGLKTMGVTRFWSVPYSLMAEDIKRPIDSLTIKASSGSLDDAIFEVKNKNGQTVFAVYNEGVRVYVSDGKTKGLKGGFSVGGFGADSKTESTKYFFVGKDSVRVYLDRNPATKKLKGGFAVGGYDLTKGDTIQDYLDVNSDSIRVYIDTDTSSKKLKGGFAVGGYNMTKNKPEEYLRVTRDSTRIFINDLSGKALKGGFAVGGLGAGKANIPRYFSVTSTKTNVQVKDSLLGFSVTNILGSTPSDFMKMNTVNYRLGHQSGDKLNQLMGKYNTFFGYKTGFNTTDGRENLFIGYLAGYNNQTASYNVYMGTESGKANVSGTSNVFIGFGSGKASTTSSNVYIGMKAGYANNPGAGNTYVGYCSGVDDGRPGYTGGSFNTFLGFNSGAKNYTGSGNVYLGAEASGNAKGTGRIFIGYKAGYSTTGDSLLIIEPHYTPSPLVWGDFANNIFRINGNIQYTGTIGQVSDSTFKTSLEILSPTLDKLLKLKSYSFMWKQGMIPGLELSHDRQIGLLAQNVERVFPELVSSVSPEFKTIDYSKLGVLIIPAMDELNSKIVARDKEITNLKNEVLLLRSEINDLEAKLDKIVNNSVNH